MNVFNLRFLTEDIERIGKFETEKLIFNNRRGSLIKQTDSVGTLANTVCTCQNQSWSTQINLFQRYENKICGYNTSELKYT